MHVRFHRGAQVATRLALIEALSDAAGTISAELAPSSVELRMAGQDPEFVVSVQTAEEEPTMLLPGSEPGEDAMRESATTEAEDEPVARVSLRLPQSVKARVDEMASADGISTNAWLIRAVMDALSERSGSRAEWPQPPRPPMPPSPNVIFGPSGPFGQHGVFGPEGPFGHGDVFGDRPKRPGREERRSRGSARL